jgi:hypothetical protein
MATALVVFIFLPAMLAAGFARAADSGPAAALVMEVSGVTTPPLAVHREVAAGTRIVIAPGAHLSLLHYATCSIVSLSSGTVKVTEPGLEAGEAKIESTQPGPCPRMHKIALAGPGPLGGGIVARGINRDSVDYAGLAPDGLVVITGARAASAESADVFDSNRRLVDGAIPIRQESFRLNGALPPKRPYFINIHFRGQSEPLEVPVSISASDTGRVLILQLE